MRKQLKREKDIILKETRDLTEERGNGDPKHDGEGKSRVKAGRGLERSRSRLRRRTEGSKNDFSKKKKTLIYPLMSIVFKRV